jgi:hypothetical protein
MDRGRKGQYPAQVEPITHGRQDPG